MNGKLHGGVYVGGHGNMCARLVVLIWQKKQDTFWQKIARGEVRTPVRSASPEKDKDNDKDKDNNKYKDKSKTRKGEETYLVCPWRERQRQIRRQRQG